MVIDVHVTAVAPLPTSVVTGVLRRGDAASVQTPAAIPPEAPPGMVS